MDKTQVDIPAHMKMDPSVHIKKAKNGFVVEVMTDTGNKSYVYKSIADALSELESVFSVTDEEKKDMGSGDTMVD